MKRFILAGLMLMLSCVTYRLEHRLPADIWNWYELHQNIMQAKVPDYIDAKKSTEARYFLGLSTELQYKYMKLFWKIRWIEAKTAFETTLKIANAAFRGEGLDGWRTERGRMLLQLGQPDDAYQYKISTNGESQSSNEGQEMWDGYNKHYQVWCYRYGGGFLVNTVSFIFEFGSQRRWTFNGVMNTDQIRYFDWYQHQMSPLDWNLWLEVIQ
jgi:GWxTD domain-containing protein